MERAQRHQRDVKMAVGNGRGSRHALRWRQRSGQLHATAAFTLFEATFLSINWNQSLIW